MTSSTKYKFKSIWSCRSKLPKKTHTHLNYSYIRQNVVWWAIVCNPFRTLNLFKPAEDWNPVVSQSCLKEENLIHIQNWTTFKCHYGIFINLLLLLFFFWKTVSTTNGDCSSPILTLFSTLLKAPGLKTHPVQDALYQWNCNCDPRHIIFAYKNNVSQCLVQIILT